MAFLQNFMLQDVFQALLACLMFPLFTILPGFVLAHGLDLLWFRKQSLGDRLAIAVVLSLGCFPIVLYLAGHFGGVAGMWVLSAAIWAAALFFVLRKQAGAAGELRWLIRWSPLGLGLALFLILTGVDLAWGPFLAISVTKLDYAKHIAVTDALFRTGADPVNPFFHPGAPIGLFYYHFWHLLCSMVERVGSPWVSARSTFLGSLPWGLAGLLALIRLYLRYVFRMDDARNFRNAALLLLVSGLDIIPVYLQNLRFLRSHQGEFLVHIEWWNTEIPAWSVSLTWVPQHVISLVANLTAVLLLRWASETRLRRGAACVLAGLCIASGLGASIWVTAGCALALGLWTLMRAANRDTRPEAVLLLASGAVACAAALPYLLHLRAVSQIQLSPVAFAVRPFVPLEDWDFYRSATIAVRNLLNLAALPLNYFLEFGLYAFTALFWVLDLRRRKWKMETHEQLAAAFLSAGILLVTFFRSTMGANDLGYRGILPAQFFLLLLTLRILPGASPVRFASAERPWAVRIIRVCVVLGCLATAYDWVGTRFGPLAVVFQRPETLRLHSQTRAAYEFLRRNTAVSAMSQHNPDRPNVHSYALWGERQVVAADWFHGPLFAIGADGYRRTANDVGRLFQAGASEDVFREVTSRYRIAAVVVDSTDPVWADRNGWPSRLTPAFSRDLVRVYLTGLGSPSHPR